MISTPTTIQRQDSSMKINMSPGDVIEWFYTRTATKDTVGDDEVLWSTPTRKWVPIGSSLRHTVISICDGVLTWINDEGTFSAFTNDRLGHDFAAPTLRVAARLANPRDEGHAEGTTFDNGVIQ